MLKQICNSTSGKTTIPESEITIVELKDPTLKGVTKCHPNTQIDTETLFIDSVTDSGYLIQKVHIGTRCCNDFSGVRIFKVSFIKFGLGLIIPLYRAEFPA